MHRACFPCARIGVVTTVDAHGFGLLLSEARGRAPAGGCSPCGAPVLKSFDPRANSDRWWDELVRACKVLYLNIYEAIESELCSENPPEDEKIINIADWKRRRVWKRLKSVAGPDIKTRLRLIEYMRNRESHGESADRREEWVWIQRRVRNILGRSWESRTGPKHPEYRADDDLELWAYETAIVKLHLLRDVRAWLTTLHDGRKWCTI